MRCNFHFSGQQPSWKRRRQIREKGTAISSAILFKILAGIRSLPVAVDSFKLRKSFNVDRLRIHKTSSCSYSQLPKKGQSMTSLGRRAFVEKVSANRFAFCLLSESHCNPSLRGGIEEILARLSSSSRFNFHHSLLPLLSAAIFARRTST
jgi:hypothetical protein